MDTINSRAEDSLLIWFTVSGAIVASGVLLLIGLAADELTSKYHGRRTNSNLAGTEARIRKQVQHVHFHDATFQSSDEHEHPKEKGDSREKTAKSLGLAKEILSLNGGSFLLAAHTLEFAHLFSRIGRRLVRLNGQPQKNKDNALKKVKLTPPKVTSTFD